VEYVEAFGVSRASRYKELRVVNLFLGTSTVECGRSFSSSVSFSVRRGMSELGFRVVGEMSLWNKNFVVFTYSVEVEEDLGDVSVVVPTTWRSGSTVYCPLV
jgi:hypothetical protein